MTTSASQPYPKRLPPFVERCWKRWFASPPPTLLRMLWPELMRWRWLFFGVVLLLPISAVMASIPPWLIKVAIDDYLLPAANERNLAPYWPGLVKVASLAIAAVLIDYVTDAVYIASMQRVGQNLLAALRARVFAHTLRLPRAYFDSHPIGTVLTRITSDVEALGESLSSNALQLVIDVLKMVAFLIAMFLLDWRLTLALLLIVPLLMVVIRFFRVRIRIAFYEARHALSDATGWLQECLAGVKALQLFRAEASALQSYTRKNQRFLRAQNISNFHDAALYSIVESVTVLAMVVVLAFGASQVQFGILSLGVLVAFMEYIQRLFVPLKEFSQQLALLQRSMAALSHINQICETPPAVSEQHHLALKPSKEGFHSLEFRQVRFAYTPQGEEILKGVNFSLQRGQTLAIVGATGAGKSSIVKLLMRAYEGYQGHILLNGRELKEYPAETLARLIAVVHQDVFLFQGSLAFNIAMEEIPSQQIRQAAEYTKAAGFIERLKGGYQHQVLRGGSNFSAGQRQLLSLARAVAWESELIVLDEATSAVDSITEQAIQTAVHKLFQDRTVIAIAHRLSTIRSADSILVIDQGRVAESGSHETLLQQAGLYARLVSNLESESSTSADITQ